MNILIQYLGDMMKANGRRYTGEFVQGKRHGKGEMTFPNGDKYTGDWNEGRRTGHGLYLFANGNRYVLVGDRSPFFHIGRYR